MTENFPVLNECLQKGRGAFDNALTSRRSQVGKPLARVAYCAKSLILLAPPEMAALLEQFQNERGNRKLRDMPLIYVDYSVRIGHSSNDTGEKSA